MKVRTRVAKRGKEAFKGRKQQLLSVHNFSPHEIENKGEKLFSYVVFFQMNQRIIKWGRQLFRFILVYRL